VDHAHPEYSTPECASPRDVVVHDKAGERILERSLQTVQEYLAPGDRLTGPALIEEYASTTVVFAGDVVTVTDNLELVVDVRGKLA